MFLTIKLCTHAKLSKIELIIYIKWIWCWITYNGWYAIKPNQLTKYYIRIYVFKIQIQRYFLHHPPTWITLNTFHHPFLLVIALDKFFLCCSANTAVSKGKSPSQNEASRLAFNCRVLVSMSYQCLFCLFYMQLWPTRLGHISAGCLQWYADEVGCTLVLVAISRSHLIWIPGSRYSCHACSDRRTLSLRSRPLQALTLIGEARIITWRKASLFRGMPTELEAFLKPTGTRGLLYCALYP